MDLEFARCQLHALSPSGVHKPLVISRALVICNSTYLVHIIQICTQSIFEFEILNYSDPHAI